MCSGDSKTDIPNENSNPIIYELYTIVCEKVKKAIGWKAKGVKHLFC